MVPVDRVDRVTKCRTGCPDVRVKVIRDRLSKCGKRQIDGIVEEDAEKTRRDEKRDE
jgi:hypothetical protein